MNHPDQQVESLSGYVEFELLDPTPQIESVLGYVEWIGTPSPIALAEDSQINTIVGYAEFQLLDPTPHVEGILGYVEFEYLNPTPQIEAVFGYLEWTGTPAPIALAEDSQVNTILGYAEFIDVGEAPAMAYIAMQVYIS